MSDQKATNKSYEFYAGMTCDGCKNAITRILTKVDGVTKIDADVPNKKLVVEGTASKDTILASLQKWSTASKKEVRFVKETSGG